MNVVNGVTLESQQHILLEDVSWDLYEHLLRELGNRPLRVTYDQGRMEIMSPLPKHERWGQWIARLIELMCLQRSIYVESLGSTTFRERLKLKGLEPDKCFYIQHAEQAREMEDEFDPAIHSPPDLAIEIDITSRSIRREPIYAALAVPELWRFDGNRLSFLHLSPRSGKYVAQTRSKAFPFITVSGFQKFVLRMRDKDQIRTLREFGRWVDAL
jgi:Uma2 family endonuclease